MNEVIAGSPTLVRPRTGDLPSGERNCHLTLSVIMPALNEQENIERAILRSLQALERFEITGDVIVINDGSRDDTRAVVESLMKCHTQIKLINHDKPRGIGYSFIEGAKSSDKEVVVMFPGDNENNPDDALEYFKLMEHVDIVIPFIHNVEVRDKKRRLISSLYRFIVNVSFGTNLNYTNGTVFYRRCLIDGIKRVSRGFFYQAELLIKLIRKGYLFAEVPNFLDSRGKGASKATTLKSLLRVMGSYIRTMYEIHIRRIESEAGYRIIHEDSMAYRKCKLNGGSTDS
jgi:glycosyltransferase involved in cell wall biosynthesis